MGRTGSIILGICILAGLVLGGLFLGRSVERFNKEVRYISVKGFAEREVKADLVIWAIKLRTADNDLLAGNQAMEASKTKVLEFLTRNGISNKEIIQRDLTVTDKQANEYGGNNTERFRYIIEETIEIRSTNVENVQKVSRMTNELLNAGVALSTKSDWSGAGLRFMFTKLNDIKPGMLTEAIQNAKKAAEQFTQESNTDLGKLRKASQGLFSIDDRDNFGTQVEGGGYAAGTSDLYKKVRVVINVEYSIE
jgi:uncharacterized protein